MDIKYINCFDSEFEQVKRIRTEVFTDEQGADKNEFDRFDSDAETRFCLIYKGSKAVATGRIVKLGEDCKIGRIAVLKSERGLGTGRILVESLCESALNSGAKRVFVDAQLHAVAFYEKLGFKPTGENEIIDRGIAHLPMRKD